MRQKTAGIVLHAIKYNDLSNIVDIYTELFGRMSFTVSVPKSRHSGIKNALFQPLAIIELDADFHYNRTLIHIKNAKMAYPFSSIPFDRKKTTIAFFIAEFMLYALRKESENKPLFSYLKNSIIWLDSCENNFSNFHLAFLIHLSKFLGFYPNLNDYKPRYYFDLQEGCYIDHKPLTNSFYLGPDEADLIKTFTQMNYNNMHLFRLNRSQRNRCIEIIINYYRIHIPEFPELKSLEILQELFD